MAVGRTLIRQGIQLIPGLLVSMMFLARPMAVGAVGPVETPVQTGQFGGSSAAIASHGGDVVVGIGPRVGLFAVEGRSRAVQSDLSDLLPGVVRDIVVAGDLAFAALGRGGLSIFDLSESGRMIELGHLSLPGEAVALAELDGRIFIAAGPAGLLAVEVDPPTRPLLVGRLGMGDRQSALRVASMPPYIVVASGRNMYGSQRGSHLHIVDARRPETMEPISSLELLPVDLGPIETRDRVIYAACGDELMVLDAGDPAELVETAQLRLSREVNLTDMVAVDDRLFFRFVNLQSNFAAPGGSGVLDITDPLHPEPLRALQYDPRRCTVCGSPLVADTGIAPVDGRVIHVQRDGVLVRVDFDLALEDAVRPLAKLLSSTHGLGVIDQQLLSLGPSEIRSHDLASEDGSLGTSSILTKTVPLGSLEASGSSALVVEETLAHFDQTSATVYRSDERASLRAIGSVGPLDGWLTQAISDDQAYVAELSVDGDEWMTRLASYAIDGDELVARPDVMIPVLFTDLAIAGDLLIAGYEAPVAGNPAGIQVYRVATDGLTLLSDTRIEGADVQVRGVMLLGTSAFVTTLENWSPQDRRDLTERGHVLRFDLSDPSAPQLTSSASLIADASNMIAHGNRLYVSLSGNRSPTSSQDGLLGVAIFDIEDRHALPHLGFLRTPAPVLDLAILDHNLYLAAADAGIYRYALEHRAPQYRIFLPTTLNLQ